MKEETLKGSSRIPETKSFSPSAELEKMHFGSGGWGGGWEGAVIAHC